MVPEQSCDFDAEQGLVKAWAYMGGLRPLDDILDTGNVSDSIKQHRNTFHRLNLKEFRHIAVDFHSGTVNLMAKDLVEIASFSDFSISDMSDMSAFISPDYFTFAVTIKVATGEIKRVAFYALGLPPRTFPDIGERLSTFFTEAPSHDEEDFTAVAWSFGMVESNTSRSRRAIVEA